MKIAVQLARHRRLVAWVGLSLLLHLLALASLDVLIAPPAPAIGAPFALRLVRERPPATQASAQPSAARPEAVPEPEQTPPALPPMRPVLPAAATTADASPRPASATPGAAPLQMPGRYRVRLPPSARLRYAVTRSAPGQPALSGEPAQLVWESDNGAYRLRLDGVLGQLESEGGEDDAGIAPRQASEPGPAGGTRATRFNREERRIEHAGLGASEPLTLGSQDRGSALMQLAAIGLAEPDQVQDTIDLVVADSGGARIVRWQVAGHEQLATPAGVLAAVRLVQLAPAGQARVELWLAPERHWLPVQLRVTQPDGTVESQTVTNIEM
ncbi:DUF3108 domain-containing protein [Massilia sp. Leaf139]|uniref:DUF3108 domain-containing protein n=1 Tax=Massilia sp. Leaf139 TaxID=1736272 RepID=UPI00138EECC9|nr:DUF3108 domain-containing protein [Massilia sp. Leaf139]